MTDSKVKVDIDVTDGDDLKTWILNVSDEAKLIIQANSFLKVERVLTGAKTYVFTDEKDKTILSFQTTGEMAKEWLDWHIQMVYNVGVMSDTKVEEDEKEKTD